VYDRLGDLYNYTGTITRISDCVFSMAQHYLKIDEPELDCGVCCESSLLDTNITIASSSIKQTSSRCLLRYCSTAPPPNDRDISAAGRIKFDLVG
jgi:hypothetical protein